jgi:asparagine synthase (glutamine-hydrolysing)
MMPSLHHRGPDDSGVESFRGVHRQAVLCATRLAVRDLTRRGHQPMVSPASGNALAFNGEIYNADELRRQLAARGRRFVSRTDTEVVLAAYDHWGSQAFGRLRGMFACAVWDSADESLLLARDPLGIKPMYYGVRNGQLTFASEVRAFIAGDDRAPRLSRPGLASLLATGAVEEPNTIVEGISSLPAGTFLEFRDETAKLETFWSLDTAFGDPLPINRAEATRRLRAELEDAVRRHLVSDAPLGVFLSGGLDSSTLVGLTATVSGPPRTASLVFTEEHLSEAAWIEAVRNRWGTDHHQLELTGSNFRAQLPAALAAMDQPTVDGINTYVVSGVARDVAGLTVALSGLGGDELFGGYELFRQVPKLMRLRRRFPSLPRPVARTAALAAAGRGDRSRKLARWLAGEEGSAHALQRELIDPDMRRALLGAHSPDRTEPSERIGDANDISRVELSHFMRNVLLRDSDALSMAHQLELRVPLLDQELVELVARLPPEFKLSPRRQKPLLVDAVRDLLPDAVVNRPKMGFTLPFESWLRAELRDEVRERLWDPGFGGQVADALTHSAVQELWRRFERRRTSWSRPWALYVAKVWGERHL